MKEITRIIACAHCGKIVEAHARGTKYCPECVPIMKIIRKAEARERRQRRKDLEWLEPVNEILRKAKAAKMTYGKYVAMERERGRRI